MKSGVKIFTLAEANAALPRCRELLALLRQSRKAITAKQALVDLEELTSSSAAESAEKVRALLGEIESLAADFHNALAGFVEIGCEIKDIDKGLIDFYAMRERQVVYLCWMDGEPEISHWHTLDSGFVGRKTLDQD